MKKNYFLIICLIFFVSISFAQNKKDSSKNVKIIVSKTVLCDDKIENENFNECKGFELKENTCEKCCQFQHKSNDQNCCDEHLSKKCKTKSNRFTSVHLSLYKKLLVILPLGLFLAIFFMIFIWLRREGFKLSDVLTSKCQCNNNDANSNHTSKSTSKLIAFLVAITAIIIAISAFTINIYFTIGQYKNIEHHGAWAIVALLGIGMIPYTIKSIFKK